MPKAFDDVVARAMAKRPEDRYPSAGDLGRAAVAAAHGRRAPRVHGTVAQGAVSPSGALSVPGLSDEVPTLTATAHAMSPAPARRRRAYAAGLAAATLVALGAVVLPVTRSGGAHPAAASATTTPSATPTPTPSPTPAATPRAAHVAATFRGVAHRPNAIAHVRGVLWVTARAIR